jgi:hypothetical protein
MVVAPVTNPDENIDLLAARFRVNMERIARFARLLFPGETAPNLIVGGEDVRADLSVQRSYFYMPRLRIVCEQRLDCV